MQSSVTSRCARRGFNALKVKSRADASARAGMRATSASVGWRTRGMRISGRAGLKFIHAPEIKISSHQDFESIPLIFGDGGWNVDGVFQDLSHDVMRARGVINDRTAIALGGNGTLDGAADERN